MYFIQGFGMLPQWTVFQLNTLIQYPLAILWLRRGVVVLVLTLAIFIIKGTTIRFFS